MPRPNSKWRRVSPKATACRRATKQAARWLERAAKQGLAPAQFRLGGLYEKGIGVKKDLAAARDLYAAAADKGNGKAMHNLAVLYAEGINGPPDYRTAAHWFRKAADHGIADSQYNLAILYARGIGVEQNYARSLQVVRARRPIRATAKPRRSATKSPRISTRSRSPPRKLAVQNWTAVPQPDDAINVKTPPGGWDHAGASGEAEAPKLAAPPRAVANDIRARTSKQS